MMSSAPLFVLVVDRTEESVLVRDRDSVRGGGGPEFFKTRMKSRNKDTDEKCLTNEGIKERTLIKRFAEFNGMNSNKVLSFRWTR